VCPVDDPMAGQTKTGWFGALPIVPRHRALISSSGRERLDQLAAKLLHDDPSLSSTQAFGPLVTSGKRDGPALFIGDHADTQLLAEELLSRYDYRMASLASDGDVTVLYGRRDFAFEAYRQEMLGLGELTVVEASHDPRRSRQLALRCRANEAAVARLAAQARAAGGYCVVPYQGNGGTWALAMEIAQRSGTPVRVVAPPPRLARKVNDKTWFARRVIDTIGQEARPEHDLAYGPSALAAHVVRFARKNASVIVKVPASAGSMGNIVLNSGYIAGLTPRALLGDLIEGLNKRGWSGRYPLLIETWHSPVISSPSVQLWLAGGRELPIIEGVFEQAVEGPFAKFVGAAPCTLPDYLINRLCLEAAQLAYVLQQLGYFGRCSFDSVIVGDTLEAARPHWIECNGRWGGVSIPMTLANRLTMHWQDRAEILIFRHELSASPLSTAQALARLAPLLFRAGGMAGGLVMLTPPRSGPQARLCMLAIAGSRQSAEVVMGQATAALDVAGEAGEHFSFPLGHLLPAHE